MTEAVKHHLDGLYPEYSFEIQKLQAPGWCILCFNSVWHINHPLFYVKITANAILLDVENMPWSIHYNPACETGMVRRLYEFCYEDPDAFPAVFSTIDKMIANVRI